MTLLKSNKCTPSTIGKKVLVGALTATLAVVANLALPDSISLGGFDLGVLTAQASEDVTVGDYTYTIDNGTAVLSSYNGTSSSVTVPTSMTYNGVTYKIRSIGDNAFEGNLYIETLVIPDGITSIGKAAFKNCTSLSSITIDSNIGDCSDRALNSYYHKDYSIFYNAGANADSLTVTFGSNVTYVPAYLFAAYAAQSDGEYPHVTSVVFSSSVTEVGSYAFYQCYDLKEVDMGDGLTTIDSYAFFTCNSLSDITWGSSLTTIGSYAFAYNYAQTELTLPSKLTYINDHAFIGCTGLTTLTLPESTTSLGNGAFKGCTSLSSITINGNVGDCSDRSINSYYSADYSVFYNAGANADSLTVTFGSNVTYVPAYLFASTSSQSDGEYPHVTSVTLSGSIGEVGSYAFYHCYDLKELDMGSGLTTIDSYAFFDCYSLSDIKWGSNLTTIDSYAFAYNFAMTELSLPSKVTYINDYAFIGCSNLTTLTLPKSTTSLGKGAFKDCTGLSSITINGTIGNCNDRSANSYYYADYSVFYNAGANAESLKVTFGSDVTSVPAYLFASASSQSDALYPHVTSVVLSDSVTEVSSYAFYHCYDLKEFDMGSGLTTVGSYAFFDCYSLNDIKWGSSLTTIDSYAFAYNFAMTELSLPSKVTYINDYAFVGCSNLATLTLPKSTTSLGKCAFKDCTGLSSIIINGTIGNCNDRSANSYYYADNSVFYNAGANTDSLTVTFTSSVNHVPAYLFATASSQSDGYYAHVTSVVLSDSVTGIGEKAFYNCYDLKELKGGNGLTSIGAEAFCNCSSLASIEISDYLNELDDSAFNNCNKLTDVYYTCDEENWDTILTDEISDCLKTATVHYIIRTYDITECTVTLEYNSASYTGSEIKPAVTVDDLVEGTNYKVAYSNNVNVGTATVTVTGLGNYTGSYETTFEIVKAKQSVTASIESETIECGGTSQITASGIGTLTYSSSDEGVATVSKSGLVSAIKAGVATITVTADGNSNTNSASTTIDVTVEEEEPEYVLGDLNDDGYIDYLDAMTVLRYDAELITLTDEQKLAGDVNGDGTVDSLDAILILRYDADLIGSF